MPSRRTRLLLGFQFEINVKNNNWYSDITKPAIGVGIMVTTGIAMAWVVGNDITGIGVADDMSIVPLGATFNKGLIMIFGG